MADPFQMLSVKDERSNIRSNARQGGYFQPFRTNTFQSC